MLGCTKDKAVSLLISCLYRIRAACFGDGKENVISFEDLSSLAGLCSGNDAMIETGKRRRSMFGLCFGGARKSGHLLVISCPYPGCVPVVQRKELASLVSSCLYPGCVSILRTQNVVSTTMSYLHPLHVSVNPEREHGQLGTFVPIRCLWYEYDRAFEREMGTFVIPRLSPNHVLACG